MPIKREIVYPFFLECIQHCSDSFWENLFEDLAYGRPPPCTYINKNFLCCSFKGKEFSYKIEKKDPEVLYNDLHKILTEKIGIFSQKEKYQKKFIFHEIEKSLKDSSQNWSDIRKKNIKDVLYEKFVIDMQKQYNLTVKQAKYLLSIIMLSIMFKTIKLKDVKYDNDKIVSINGIEFEEGKIILKRDICADASNFDFFETENEIEPKKIMSENWGRYVKSLKDIRVKNPFLSV